MQLLRGSTGCCTVLLLSVSPDELLEAGPAVAARRWGVGPRTFVWATTELYPLTQTEAEEWAPWMFADPRAVNGRYPFGCPHYDQDIRRCTDWENRPEVCSGYPRYGRDRVPSNGLLAPGCEFRRDQGASPDREWVPVRMTLGRRSR